MCYLVGEFSFYDADNQRDYSVLTKSNNSLPFAAGKRYYFGDFERNINTENNVVTDLDYIFAYGRLVALIKATGGTKTTYGAMTDRQGSLRALYNGSGLVQSFSYDAWGNRRNPSTGVALTTPELVTANSITARGYTCHKHMDEFGLINMNARIYDPALGMFISVDPLAQEYYNTYPYAYCGGDPVNAVDPTGKLIIFINGFHNGTQGAKPRYWETQSGKFDEAIMKHFKDDNKLYYDGSFGGIFGIYSNIIMKNRFDMGYTVGLKEASDYI